LAECCRIFVKLKLKFDQSVETVEKLYFEVFVIYTIQIFFLMLVLDDGRFEIGKMVCRNANVTISIHFCTSAHRKNF